MKVLRLALSTALAVVLLDSCGSNKRTTTQLSSAQIVVAVSPTTVSIDQGATQQFTAMVMNSANTAVVWSVLEGNAGGSIDAQGMYTAPAVARSVHVVATSVADPSKTSSALISVNPVGLTVAPNLADLQTGDIQQFTATVTGTVNHRVVWSVVESNGGTISDDGAYIAPEMTGTYHIVAKSVADASRSVTVPVTVAQLALSITPASIEISPGKAISLTAAVSGCMDDRVTWAVQEGSRGGSITGDGTYVAPAELGEYHVLATSVAHPNLTAIAGVRVRNSGFTDAGNMTMIRVDHTATLLPNGDVLLVGGGTFTNGTYSETASAEIFDHSTKKFSPAGSISTARRWHTATLLSDGKVLVAGGGVDGGWDYYPMDSAELYDPASRQNVHVQNMQAARLGHTATLMANGKVLIAGGYVPDMFLSSTELFDPETLSFTPTGEMHQPRSGHTATLLSDGRVLILGGCMRCKDQQNTAEIYDPSTGLFTDAGSYWRIAHTATLMDDGRILTVGGYSYDDVFQYVYYDDAQFFNVSTGEVQVVAKMSGKRFGHTATKLPSGRVLVVGGFEKIPIATAEVFDPSTTAFFSVDSMTHSRFGHTATLLSSGEVLITGGTSETTVAGEQSAELYTESR